MKETRFINNGADDRRAAHTSKVTDKDPDFDAVAQHDDFLTLLDVGKLRGQKWRIKQSLQILPDDIALEACRADDGNKARLPLRQPFLMPAEQRFKSSDDGSDAGLP